MTKAIIVKDVCKTFHVGTQVVQILKNISFEINERDFVVIFGPSGCGKSTLLHGLLGLEIPTSGTIELLGKNIYSLNSEDERSDFRKNHIGMVYQQPNWIKSLTVLENITFPLLLRGEDNNTASEKAKTLLKIVDLIEWIDYIPTELSSGQQQRIALVRALVTNPEIIIADEPTGNLDYESGQALMELLGKLNEESGKTIVMVTHDLEYLKFAKTAIKMFDGTVEGIFSEKDKSALMRSIKSKRGVVAKKVKT